MWIAQFLHGGIMVCTRPLAFDILEQTLNDPTTRRALLDAAAAPEGFDWQGFAIGLGIEPENIERFTAEWPDRDVIIQGVCNAVLVATDEDLRLELVPAIADVTRVDLAIRGDVLQVVVAAPDESVRRGAGANRDA